MEDDKTNVALGQLHDDMQELIGVIKANHERLTKVQTKMRRFSFAIIGFFFIYLSYPSIYCFVKHYFQ